MKLPYKELLELIEDAGDLPVGKTTYVHHCKEGHSNKSCGVTRTNDATLVHCFHCEGRGVVRVKFARVRQFREGEKPVVKRHWTPPTDSTEDTSQWSIKALAWIGKGGLTLQEANQWHMRWSKTAGRVYIPLLKGEDIVGWLGRQIECEGQKYLLQKNNDFMFHIDKGTDECIIVEDSLSAIRIGRQYSVVALLGTSLSDYAVGKLSKRYKRFGIWLDNDNAKVKMKQVQARNRLSAFGKVRMIKTDDDPKTYSDKQIKGIINE
jgi:DNA primase